jgi:hypothetical protein
VTGNRCHGVLHAGTFQPSAPPTYPPPLPSTMDRAAVSPPHAPVQRRGSGPGWRWFWDQAVSSGGQRDWAGE